MEYTEIDMGTLLIGPSSILNHLNTPRFSLIGYSNFKDWSRALIETVEEEVEEEEDDEEQKCPDLPPTDGGKAAWTFMLGAVLVDAVVWAFPLNYGVFQNYYTSHDPFIGNTYISMIGTFATGIAYLGGPLMAPITIRFHAYLQYLVLLGTAFCVAGTIGASFCTNIGTLIFCQGVLYGTGFLIISYSSFALLNGWFVERRGLAYGILLSASGISGIGLPFLLETLLNKYGAPTTLRIYTLASVIIVLPSILLLRSRTGRITKSQSLDINEKRKRIDYSTLRKPIFTFLSICNFLQGLVFYLPGIFLPSYATSLNLTATQSSILLALLNLTSVLGTLIFGYLSDIVDIHILLSISCLGSCLAVFTLWGMARTFLPLLLFSMIFGFLGGSFESLFPRFATAMTSDPDAEITFYGFFEFERGLGMVLAGPISSVLVQRFKDSGAGLGSYGGGVYVGIVVFTGITLGVSAFAGVGWFFRARRWYK